MNGELGHLLHRGGSQDDHVEVTVTAALGGLEVVGLRGLDTAETGAAALDVDHQRGEIGAGQVGQALALEGDSGGGGGGHDAGAGGGHAVDHVDGGNLGLSLEEHAADLGETLGHVGRDLGLGGDGVTEVVAAARDDGGLRDGLVTLHKYLICHVGHSPFSTLMMQSGHMVAQKAQPMQSSMWRATTGW